MNLRGLEKPRKLSSSIVGVQAELRTGRPPNSVQLGFHVNHLCRCNAFLLYAYRFLVFVCRTGSCFFLFYSKIVLFLKMILFTCVSERRILYFKTL